MTENQNDPRNKNAERKSHQQETQEGKKTEEVDPNKVKAKQPGSQGANQEKKDAKSPIGETDIDVQDNEENEEETTASKSTVDSDSKDNKSNNGNQNTGKAGL